jgi:hypothetical protein
MIDAEVFDAPPIKEFVSQVVLSRHHVVSPCDKID